MPDDFRGLKMRIQGSKVLDAISRELGALPQILPFSAVYQSLQTGVVDGEDNVPSNILTQRFYEVQKNLTVSYHGRLTYALITNKNFWNSLPPDVRSQLDRAVKESTVFFNDAAAKDNADALKKIKASGKTRRACFDRGREEGLDRQADAGARGDAKPVRQSLHRAHLQGVGFYSAPNRNSIPAARGLRTSNAAPQPPARST